MNNVIYGKTSSKLPKNFGLLSEHQLNVLTLALEHYVNTANSQQRKNTAKDLLLRANILRG